MSSKLEQIATLVATDTGQAVDVGRKYLARQDRWPRVVMVPLGGEWAPPEAVGGKAVSGTTRQVSAWTRKLRVQIYVWAQDLGTAESLVESVALSLRKIAGVALPIGNEVWETQEDPEEMTDGEQVSIQAILPLPVIKESAPLTELSQGAITCQIS